MNLLSFTTLVSNAAAAVQAACSSLLDMTAGSVLRAILEANASIALWMQWLILQVLALTRAATSTGTDLDSWMADYSLTRLPAVAATGNVTFTRFTPTNTATIVPGTQVQTADGTAIFAVTTDTTNGLWNVGLGAYLIPANTASITVPVQAVTAGSGGNVQAGTVTLIATGIPGVDTVTNGSAFTNGIAAESDTALRARFVLYIASLRYGTIAAFEFAIATVQQGIYYDLIENYDSDGAYDPGFVSIYIDDGTGSPPTSLLNAVAAAVSNVRGASIRIGVFGPTVLVANVSMTVTTAVGYTHAAVVAAAQTALTAAINSTQMGAGLSFTSLIGVVYATSPGVTNVTAYSLNSGTTDIAGASGQVIRAGTMGLT